MGIKDDYVPECLTVSERFRQDLEALKQKDVLIFYMFWYKTSWCKNKDAHDSKSCDYAHHTRDFRRPPEYFAYTAEDCPTLANSLSWSKCKDGILCKKCHTTVERLYHPDKYKRVQCDKARCNNNPICAFFHEPAEKQLCSQKAKNFKKKALVSRHELDVKKLHKLLRDFYLASPKTSFHLSPDKPDAEEVASDLQRSTTFQEFVPTRSTHYSNTRSGPVQQLSGRKAVSFQAHPDFGFQHANFEQQVEMRTKAVFGGGMDQSTLSMPFGDNPENAPGARNRTIPKNGLRREDFLGLPQEKSSFSKGSLLGVPVDCADQSRQQREQELFQPFGNFMPCVKKTGSPLSNRAADIPEEDEAEFEDLQKDIIRQLEAPPSPLKMHKKSSIDMDFIQPALKKNALLYLESVWRPT